MRVPIYYCVIKFISLKVKLFNNYYLTFSMIKKILS